MNYITLWKRIFKYVKTARKILIYLKNKTDDFRISLTRKIIISIENKSDICDQELKPTTRQRSVLARIWRKSICRRYPNFCQTWLVSRNFLVFSLFTGKLRMTSIFFLSENYQERTFSEKRKRGIVSDGCVKN